MEYMGTVLVGAMGAAKGEMATFETGAGGGSTDATLWMDSASDTL